MIDLSCRLQFVRLAVVALTTCLGLAAGLSAQPTATQPAPGTNAIPADEKHVADLIDRIGDDLQRTETEHYVVLYDAGLIFAGSRARIAERTLKAFVDMFSAMGLPLRPITTKLVMVVFRDQARYVRYASRLGYDANKMDGFYSIKSDTVVLFDSQTDGDYRQLARRIDAHRESLRTIRDQLRRIKSSGASIVVRLPGRPARTMTRTDLARQVSRDTRTLKKNERELNRLAGQQNASKSRHEAAHQLAMHTGVQPRGFHNPFWVTEGLACQFEVRLTAAGLERNAFPRERLEGFRTVRKGKYFRSLEELIRAEMSTSMSHDELLSLYSQAWGLFYYLRVQRPRQLVSYLRALAAEPPTAATSARARVKRFRAHFTEDLERIERDAIAFIDSLR